jgi:hypothetical protein
VALTLFDLQRGVRRASGAADIIELQDRRTGFSSFELCAALIMAPY